MKGASYHFSRTPLRFSVQILKAFSFIISIQPWPITGGEEGEISQASSLIITGHADGSIKFWDATSNLLLPCYKITLSRLFEKKRDSHDNGGSQGNGNHGNGSQGGNHGEYYDDPYAIQHLSFCPQGRVLAAVCQSYFLAVFSFSAQENTMETVVSIKSSLLCVITETLSRGRRKARRMFTHIVLLGYVRNIPP